MQRILIALAGLALAGSANAAAFSNGSFESGTFFDNTGAKTEQLNIGSTAMTGWTVIGVNGDTSDNIAWEMVGNGYNIAPSDGSYNLDLTGYSDRYPYAGVRQTFDTIAGHTYTLMYDVGASSNYTPSSGATVQAAINGAALYSYTNANVSSVSTWMTGSTSFTATSASTQLDLIGTAGGYYIGLDNVRVADVTPASPSGVPEPASWAMMIGGFGMVGGAARRSRAGSAAFA